MDDKVKAIWFLGIVLIIAGVLWAYENIMDKRELQPLNQFCQERGYKEFAGTERWTYKATDVLSIMCFNEEQEYVFVESIDVYNEVFNKPRER